MDYNYIRFHILLQASVFSLFADQQDALKHGFLINDLVNKLI